MTTSTYFLPAIFLNPVVVLHSINTYFSYRFPQTAISISNSPHALIAKIGPDPSCPPYIDVHNNENLCWTYTFVMVCAQIYAYSKIGGNRLRKKSKLRKDGKVLQHSRWSGSDERKGAELDASKREKRKERSEMDQENMRGSAESERIGGLDGAHDSDALPYTPKPRTRRQVRLLRSSQSTNENGTVDPDHDRSNKQSLPAFAGDLKKAIHGEGLRDEEQEDAVRIGDTDEAEDSESDKTSTSEELMIL